MIKHTIRHKLIGRYTKHILYDANPKYGEIKLCGLIAMCT